MIVIKRVSPPIKKMYSKNSKIQIVKLRDLIVAAERVKLKAHSPPPKSISQNRTSSLLSIFYIIKIIVQDWIVTAVEAHIVESKFQN